MTALVAGGFGCIGSWVIRMLLAGNEQPILFDLGDDPWRLRMVAGPDVESRVAIVRGDIVDLAALTRVVREHDGRRVVHLGAWQIPLCRRDPSCGTS